MLERDSKPARDLVTFGEAMIRLAPPNHRRLEQATTLDVTVGGAELNVAAGVSRLGLTAEWVSRLPNNPLGRMARNRAREFGVDVSHVEWDEDGRMGLYFVEYGASPRPSTVLYDRADSAFQRLAGDRFEWTNILHGSRAFHTTGITTALGDRPSSEVAMALRSSRAAGVLTAYDLNHRSRLWDVDRAREVQTPLMSFVDVLITTEEDAERVFGVSRPNPRDVAKCLSDMFGFKVTTITLRGDVSVLRNTWTSIAFADGQFFDDRVYEVELIDRVGGGDAYAAGFLYGLLTYGVPEAVRYGNAYAALKQTSWGDLSYATLEEVERQLNGTSLRIRR